MRKKLVKTIIKNYCKKELFEDPLDDSFNSIKKQIQEQLDSNLVFKTKVISLSQGMYDTEINIEIENSEKIIIKVNRPKDVIKKEMDSHISRIKVDGRSIKDILSDIEITLQDDNIYEILSEEDYVLVDFDCYDDDENQVVTIIIPTTGKACLYEDILYEDDKERGFVSRLELNEYGYPSILYFNNKISHKYEHDELGRPIKRINYNCDGLTDIDEIWEYDVYNGFNLAIRTNDDGEIRLFGIDCEASYSFDDDYVESGAEFLKDYYRFRYIDKKH